MRFLIPAALVAIGCALGCLAVTLAQEQKRPDTSTPSDGTQLPKPDPEFKGKIGETYKDSTPELSAAGESPERSTQRAARPARRRRLRDVLDVRRPGADPAPRQAREERTEL